MMNSFLLLATIQLSHAFLLAGWAPQLVSRPPVQRAAVSAGLQDGLRAAGVATLASVVLITSPMAAHAKGGGHGGGGHGGSGHSSYHSSGSSSRRTLHQYHGSGSSRTSSRKRSSRGSSGYSSTRTYHSTTYASPPPPIRLYPDESSARQGEGFYCPANLPRPGERVDVQGGAAGYRTATVISSTPATQASLYGKDGQVLQPTPGFESDCTVQVQYSDGTTGTLSAAEEPTPLWQEAAPFVAYGALTAVSYGDFGESDHWQTAKEKHDALLAELGPGGDAPPSGEWWGSSEESDEGDQAVRSTLKFGADGTVRGHGKDGVDGAYRIVNGRWGVLGTDATVTVAWIEKYDEGFSVAVKGTYNERRGKIVARFTSDRGVRGAFELAPKPSIF